MIISQQQIEEFRQFIWQFYQNNRRSFAWRETDDPYQIMVSEIMLQQTQVHRVAPKFEQFITTFATVHDLAQAQLQDVLLAWQGLGYNRRAKALLENARAIVQNHDGCIPDDPNILVTLHHIGPNTAASIAAFAYNKPTVFIETNIRTVFLHSFFKDQPGVHDKQLMPLISATLDISDPRNWYYALMDYGVYLKVNLPNPSRQSAHHSVQSKFHGSDRQIRGKIVKQLALHGSIDKNELFSSLGPEFDRYEKILQGLVKDSMARVFDGQVRL